MRGLFRQCRVEKQFFFEKKNQKTFARCRGLIPSTYPRHKSFLLLFFKKEVLLLF
jgi:hypothetical protein